MGPTRSTRWDRCARVRAKPHIDLTDYTKSVRPILVSNVNISLVGLMFSSSIFQKVQQSHVMDKRMWNPFKMIWTKDWLKLKAQDSTFPILVIQDHIESIGKPILLKGDEVLLNGLLA